MYRIQYISVAAFVLVVIIFCITLYPFRFCPPNGVQIQPGNSALCFNGCGVAYADPRTPGTSVFDTEQVSIELLVREPLGSSNNGPREIFSFYDGKASPPLVIGKWGGRIFMYSRFDEKGDAEWYSQFRPDRLFTLDLVHLVTVVSGSEWKMIFLDGVLLEKKHSRFPEGPSMQSISRLMLCSSPFGKNGWMGELKGVAVYDRALAPEEVGRHYILIAQQGVRPLAGTPGLRVLYAFDDVNDIKGGTIQCLVEGPWGPIIIPERHIPLATQFFHLPGENMHMGSTWLSIDFILNILFFIPLGFLLGLRFCCRQKGLHGVGYVILLCAGLSLVIEILQLLIPDRFPSFLDVLSNTVGGAAGAIVALLISGLPSFDCGRMKS